MGLGRTEFSGPGKQQPRTASYAGTDVIRSDINRDAVLSGSKRESLETSDRLGIPQPRATYIQSNAPQPHGEQVQRDIAPTVPGGNPIAGMVNRNPITSVDPATAQRAMQMGAPKRVGPLGPPYMGGPDGNFAPIPPRNVGDPILDTQQGPIRRDLKPVGRSGALRRPAPTMEEIQRRLFQLQQQRGGPLGPPR